MAQLVLISHVVYIFGLSSASERPSEWIGGFVRKTSTYGLLFVFLLVVGTVTASGGQDQCDELKTKMDNEFVKYIGLSDDADKAEDALLIALERQTAAEGAYAEAVRAVKKADKAWRAAHKKWSDCGAKKPLSKCTAEKQAYLNALDALVKAESNQKAMAVQIGAAAFDLAEYKAKAEKAEKAARDARAKYLNALQKFADCVNPPPMKKVVLTPMVAPIASGPGIIS